MNELARLTWDTRHVAFQLLTRKSCAQSERPIIIFPAQRQVIRGIAANGLTQKRSSVSGPLALRPSKSQ